MSIEQDDEGAGIQETTDALPADAAAAARDHHDFAFKF
jgi:hypothetical protein